MKNFLIIFLTINLVVLISCSKESSAPKVTETPNNSSTGTGTGGNTTVECVECTGCNDPNENGSICEDDDLFGAAWADIKDAYLSWNGVDGCSCSVYNNTGSGGTCSDGIQNGDETGVDCGGSCVPCSGSGSCGTVTDIDGNTYNTTQIGTQCWLTEDMRVTKYPDGTPIPQITDATSWLNLLSNGTDDAYCFYENFDDGVYGVLYTWAAAMGDNATGSDLSPSGVQGLCPDGYHIPSQAEWIVLADYLNDAAVRGGMLKESGTLNWLTPNTAATNETGFTALPTGYRNYGTNAPFVGRTENGHWWSSSDIGSGLSYVFKLYYNSGGTTLTGGSPQASGRCVRCLKD